MALTEEEKKARRGKTNRQIKEENKAKRAAGREKKKAPAQPAPAGNFQMPAPAGAPAAGQNNQLDQALAMPMPDISALLAQSGKQDIESKNAMLNSGLIRGLRRDAYGDVQTGSNNPWKNGTFGTQQQQNDRANAGYEQRMKELARPAGQYNIPKPQATLPAPDFVPRGGVNGVQNLQNNWNQGIAEMPMAGPKTEDQFVAEINAKYPALASIGARPDMPVQPPATVPSESALAYVNEVLNPVYATTQQREAAGYGMPASSQQSIEQDRGEDPLRTMRIIPEAKRFISAAETQTTPTPWTMSQEGVIPQLGEKILDFGSEATDFITDKGSQFINYLMGTNVEGTNLQQEGLHTPIRFAPPQIPPPFQGITRSGIRPDGRNFNSLPQYPEPSDFSKSSTPPLPPPTPQPPQPSGYTPAPGPYYVNMPPAIGGAAGLPDLTPQQPELNYYNPPQPQQPKFGMPAGEYQLPGLPPISEPLPEQSMGFGMTTPKSFVNPWNSKPMGIAGIEKMMAEMQKRAAAPRLY
jgi:hypothetical protein